MPNPRLLLALLALILAALLAPQTASANSQLGPENRVRAFSAGSGQVALGEADLTRERNYEKLGALRRFASGSPLAAKGGGRGGLRPTQKAVSGPQVDRLAADMADNGFNPNFPVKVDGNFVVEGHHRVMAAKKAGVEIVTQPATAANAAKANALKSFDDIIVDLVDWYE